VSTMLSLEVVSLENSLVRDALHRTKDGSYSVLHVIISGYPFKLITFT
jgi:hypothetical protein